DLITDDGGTFGLPDRPELGGLSTQWRVHPHATDQVADRVHVPVRAGDQLVDVDGCSGQVDRGNDVELLGVDAVPHHGAATVGTDDGQAGPVGLVGELADLPATSSDAGLRLQVDLGCGGDVERVQGAGLGVVELAVDEVGAAGIVGGTE